MMMRSFLGRAVRGEAARELAMGENDVAPGNFITPVPGVRMGGDTNGWMVVLMVSNPAARCKEGPAGGRVLSLAEDSTMAAECERISGGGTNGCFVGDEAPDAGRDAPSVGTGVSFFLPGFAMPPLLPSLAPSSPWPSSKSASSSL